MKKDWKAMQDRSVWENSVKRLCGMVKGTRDNIENRLKISHSQVWVSEIMDKIDLIIENATDMGMSLVLCDRWQDKKDNLNRARQERMSEDELA